MRITTKLLKKYNACKDQAELFVSLFPEGTEVTEEACLKALEGGINFEWACKHLLKDQNAYYSVKNPAFAAYDDAHRAARIKILEHNTTMDSILDSILDSYNASVNLCVAGIIKQQALTFCKCFNEENP